LQILPQAQIEQIQPQPFATPPQNFYIAEGLHAPVIGMLPSGKTLAVGEKTKFEFQTREGKPFEALLAEHPETKLTPRWQVTKGQERVTVKEDGTIEPLALGEATIQGTLPGLASDKGFLFISALGRVGAFDPDGTIHWDIVGMVLCYGLSLYLNQTLAGQGSTSSNPQQQTVNQLTPVIFSGMFLFFPLPAGVLMYMLIANIFQTIQTYTLSREPLPENLQKIVEESEAKSEEDKGREALPFEPRSKKKASG
jgi:YidC/Oxa1 family membrane protein insertase